jgi:hypothetical protein
MPVRTFLAATLLAVAAPVAAASAESPSCSGVLSGAVTGTFACSVTLRTDGGKTRLVISTDDRVAGVRALLPASFDLPGPLQARTYTLRTLGGGESRVETSAGARYLASAGQGEAELILDRVERYAQPRGFLLVSGTLHARLVGPGPGVVTLDVRF